MHVCDNVRYNHWTSMRHGRDIFSKIYSFLSFFLFVSLYACLPTSCCLYFFVFFLSFFLSFLTVSGNWRMCGPQFEEIAIILFTKNDEPDQSAVARSLIRLFAVRRYIQQFLYLDREGQDRTKRIWSLCTLLTRSVNRGESAHVADC